MKQTPFEKSSFFDSYKTSEHSIDHIQKMALEHAFGGIVLFHFDGTILYTNRNFRMMIGFPDMYDFSVTKIQNILKSEKGFDHLFKYLKEDGYWIGEMEVCGEMGVINILHCVSNIVYDDQYNPICIYASMTERMEYHAFKEITVQAEELSSQNQNLATACTELDQKNLNLQLKIYDLINQIDPGKSDYEILDGPALQKMINPRSTIAALHQELQHTKAQVKELTGYLPICSECKKIRDDRGSWTQIEQYIRNHSEAEFSHSICPECAERLYGDLLKDEK
ncbi:hypothetical protein [Candidatus Lokiarchaeum ossiferum]|uniref:hypothetical protein n=1 Tax=Candidatus Lokiarchaeum ossiferum TaxID=2951803 RepID=UPI00352F8AB1